MTKLLCCKDDKWMDTAVHLHLSFLAVQTIALHTPVRTLTVLFWLKGISLRPGLTPVY